MVGEEYLAEEGRIMKQPNISKNYSIIKRKNKFIGEPLLASNLFSKS